MSHTRSPLMLTLLLSLLFVLLIGPDTARATPVSPPSLRTFGRIRNKLAVERHAGTVWASDAAERSVPSTHIHEPKSVKASLPLPLKARLIPFLSTSSSVTTAAMDQLLREEMAELEEPDFQSKSASKNGSKKTKKSRLVKNH